MEATSPALQPLFRSRTLTEMLALLFLNPDREYSLTDIARHTGAALPTVHAEVTRLMAAGLVRDRRVGNVRLVRADLSADQAHPLTELLAVSFGPRPGLSRILATAPGVEQAFVHGPWAERMAGLREGIPEDVDLLVVGGLDAAELESLRERAAELLECPVHLRQASSEDWAAAVAQSAGLAHGAAPDVTSAPDLVDLAGGPLLSIVSPSEPPWPREPARDPALLSAPAVPSAAAVPSEPAASDETTRSSGATAIAEPALTAHSPEAAAGTCPFLVVPRTIGACLTGLVSALPVPAPLESAAGTLLAAADPRRWLH